MVETKKIPRFRVICKDIAQKKHKTFTVYEGDKKITFNEFVESIKKKIKEI